MKNENPTGTGSPLATYPLIPNPLDNLPKSAYPTPRFKSKRIITIILVIIAGIFGFLIAGFIIVSKSPTKPNTYSVSPTHAPNPTADWTPYTYKSLMLKHPKDWDVVFTSDLESESNDISIHLQEKGDQGIQPDEVRISTFNDRIALPENNSYKPMPLKKFSKKEGRNDDYIQFRVGGSTIYAACIFYSKPGETIAICNQILMTLKSTK